MIFLGVDLAWGEGGARRTPNASGVASLALDGRVLAAGWTRGVGATVDWVRAAAAADDAVLFVDAPLLVANPTGQRRCETEVGQRYGRWRVSANSSNRGLRHLAGVTLRRRLEGLGWSYDDGRAWPPTSGRVLSECYPYTTIVGVEELGYADERPRYKRRPRGVGLGRWRPMRAAACDELIRRMARLDAADPPLRLASHPLTRRLVIEPSPHPDRAYKAREDLLDAVLCAWTAALWVRHGPRRCQVLGAADDDRPGGPAGQNAPAGKPKRPAATIIAPARPQQRRPTTA